MEAQKIDEECARTLYVRLPHTIKNSDEIRELFTGDITIKLPRKKSRNCKVIFSSVGEKFKNYKAIRHKRINDKFIVATNYKPSKQKLFKEKQFKKKAKFGRKSRVVPAKAKQVTKICMITNVPKKAKLKELTKLLPEAKNVSFIPIPPKCEESKWALVKFKEIGTAGEYLKRERVLELRGVELNFACDTRKQKKGKKLKIHGDENKVKVKTEANVGMKEEEESDDEDDEESDGDDNDDDEQEKTHSEENEEESSEEE